MAEVRIGRLAGATLGAIATVTALVGCSQAQVQAPEDAPPATAPSAQAQGEPSHGDVPGSRSGALGQEDLPVPSALGDRWRYRVDEGDPEEGYQGSGEPAIAREPASVGEAITPLGCRPRPMPRPQHALEVTYRRGSVPAVGLVLEFASADQAERFFTTHRRVLDECESAPRADVDVRLTTYDTVVSTRTEELGHTPSWAEGAHRSGDRVTFVAVADPGPLGVRAVTSALRHLS